MRPPPTAPNNKAPSARAQKLPVPMTFLIWQNLHMPPELGQAGRRPPPECHRFPELSRFFKINHFSDCCDVGSYPEHLNGCAYLSLCSCSLGRGFAHLLAWSIIKGQPGNILTSGWLLFRERILFSFRAEPLMFFIITVKKKWFFYTCWPSWQRKGTSGWFSRASELRYNPRKMECFSSCLYT